MSKRDGSEAGVRRGRVRVPLLMGLLPITRARLGREIIAGVTLAALAIPVVLGYAKIAGMPTITGLYTMLVPVVAFALLGASRQLVVSADSATAAILAAGLAGTAVAGSAHYVRLAGTVALIAGGLLLLARLIRLGFLANFLSRTVLVGFLTGVGIQIAIGQLAQMLGVSATSASTIGKVIGTVRGLAQVHLVTVVVSVAVIVVVVSVRLLARAVPGALIAVIAAIVISYVLRLADHGVVVLGALPGGVPHLALPSFAPADLSTALPIAASMFVVILAQSSATARAHAARYEQAVDEDADLVGVGAANIASAFTGTFVVNGSPSMTEIVDSAGGRSQLAQLVSSVVALLVLVFLTGPLAYLPLAALATVVFLIGVNLIDVAGMRRIYQVRRAEFVVAVLTAAAVVFIGVEQGVLLAIVASVVDHLRHSYSPRSSLLVKSSAGHWQSLPVAPGGRSTPGLIVYRFGSSLYFANSVRLTADVDCLLSEGETPRWFCLDAAAIGDIDYSASAVLTQVQRHLHEHGIRLVLASVIQPVQHQLDRYGITVALGPDACFDTAGEALDAFHDIGRSPQPRSG